MSAESLLRLEGVSKRFGGVLAIDELNLQIAAGSIVGLIGPNGAGKTTVFNLVTRVFEVTGGRIVFDGAELTGRPHAVVRRGIARTFQNIRLFESLTVDDHLALAQRTRTKLPLNPLARWRGRASLQAERDEVLRFADLVAVRDRPATVLPYAEQRRVEIARAMMLRPRLLLLDEPAAGANPSESEMLAELVRDVRRRGITVLLIEHDMPFVMSLCDQLYVLNFGALIAEGAPRDVQRDPVVLEAYLGVADLDPESEVSRADA